MTLICDNCGSYDLEITAQYYGDDGSAFESYECAMCGATGSLSHDGTTHATDLRGGLTDDWE